MSKVIETLNQALKLGMSIRPKVGGFPYLAEALRAAGALKNTWALPSCQSIFVMKNGNVVLPGTPLITEALEIPTFNKEALIQALRTDQEGKSSFPEFLQSTWKAGVVGYEVDFSKRVVTYYGACGNSYGEEYPAVEI